MRNLLGAAGRFFGLPWRRQNDRFWCDACGITMHVTARQYLAHQREIHGPRWYVGGAL